MAPSTVPSSLLAPAVWETPSGEHVQVEVDNEQLHGRACVRCGSTLDGLVDAGHVHVHPGGWPVKACPHHTGEEAAA
jgi:hypothetical protein